MSYGLNVPALFRRAAELLDKILRGTKPADIPVEQPTTFRPVVNLKTAKALGLTIPESFLLCADTVASTKCEFRLVRVTTAHE
jgi:putative tryptophan/tyrosine transport system substrate-binding protein